MATTKADRLHQWLLYIVSVIVFVSLGVCGWLLTAVVALQISDAATGANNFTQADAYQMEQRNIKKFEDLWSGVNEAQAANKVLSERVAANIKRMDDHVMNAGRD